MNLSVSQNPNGVLIENDKLCVTLIEQEDSPIMLTMNSDIPLTSELTHDDDIVLSIIPISAMNDYNRLKNLPKLNGVTIMGDMHEIDPTVPDWIKEMHILTEWELDAILV